MSSTARTGSSSNSSHDQHFCYYCGAPAKIETRFITDGRKAWVCDMHGNKMREVEAGKNVGAGAGIG